MSDSKIVRLGSGRALDVGVAARMGLPAFEPGWVWLSGLTAAVGWSLLAWFAWHEAGPGGQTMDFVVAATTGRIDAHDEVIRVAVILIVTNGGGGNKGPVNSGDVHGQVNGLKQLIQDNEK